MSAFVFHDSQTGRVLRITTAAAPEEVEAGVSMAELPGAELPDRPSAHHALYWTGGVLHWQDDRSTEQRASDARAQRDELLRIADGQAWPYVDNGEPVPLALRTYRQALRDWPQQPGFPDIELPPPPL